MSTATVNSNKITLQSSISMFKGVEIESAYDAVMYRSELNKLEANIQRIKDECDEYLNNEFGEQKRITTQDNEFTVIRIANNRAKYRQTFIYRLASRFMKWAEATTPKDVQPVGKGYYYKSAK